MTKRRTKKIDKKVACEAANLRASLPFRSTYMHGARLNFFHTSFRPGRIPGANSSSSAPPFPPAMPWLPSLDNRGGGGGGGGGGGRTSRAGSNSSAAGQASGCTGGGSSGGKIRSGKKKKKFSDIWK